MFFDPLYLLYVAPALLLAMWAQHRVHSAYAAAAQQPSNLSGAAAARHILDQAGLSDVAIEQIPGQLSDHYDPRDKVLRLSQDVYGSRSLAAVGIAAHEAGHALQDAHQYALMTVRNAAVPIAGFGTQFSMFLFIAGLLLSMSVPVLGHWLIIGGIVLFSTSVFFQVVNLPVEFDASRRAKAVLVDLGIVPQQEMTYVNGVLNAAALTYVAATLQSVLTLLYYIVRFAGDSRRS